MALILYGSLFMNAYVLSTVFDPFKAFVYIVTSRPVRFFKDKSCFTPHARNA